MTNRNLVSIAGACLLTGACGTTTAELAWEVAAADPTYDVAAGDVTALEDVFRNAFMIGAALNVNHFYERNALDAALVKTHFNTITAESALKWGPVHPEPDRYFFADADRYVDFGTANGMFIIGHTLVWHSQTPAWVFTDAKGRPISRGKLLHRLRDHIYTVVGRYRGRIKGWEVVNEALNEDGTFRNSPWFQILGEDYIVRAFQYAQEADPQAELYYSDYTLRKEAKRNSAIRLIEKLRAAGVRVHGVALHAHHQMNWPTPAQEEATIAAFASLGLKVMISELDVDVLPPAGQYQGVDITNNTELQQQLNPYREGLPDSVQHALAQRYAELFRVYLERKDAITRVTFWGVSDATSWLNNWPVRGRTNYPLLFDRNRLPKPAFYAVVQAAQQ
jgi:endo-1,4-beta-xylanase